MIVVDASGMVAALVGREADPELLDALTGDVEASHLLDVEVLSVLRGLLRGHQLDPRAAEDARRLDAEVRVLLRTHSPRRRRTFHAVACAYSNALMNAPSSCRIRSGLAGASCARIRSLVEASAAARRAGRPVVPRYLLVELVQAWSFTSVHPAAPACADNGSSGVHSRHSCSFRCCRSQHGAGASDVRRSDDAVRSFDL